MAVRSNGNALGPFLHLFLPRRVGADLIICLFIKAPRILSYVYIVRFPIVEMANQQMMIAALDFTQRDQVIRVEF